jgi:hypothetical protein
MRWILVLVAMSVAGPAFASGMVSADVMAGAPITKNDHTLHAQPVHMQSQRVLPTKSSQIVTHSSFHNRGLGR